jgi:hypothetical protein
VPQSGCECVTTKLLSGVLMRKRAVCSACGVMRTARCVRVPATARPASPARCAALAEPLVCCHACPDAAH